jgi:hypothetical protein
MERRPLPSLRDFGLSVFCVLNQQQKLHSRWDCQKIAANEAEG